MGEKNENSSEKFYHDSEAFWLFFYIWFGFLSYLSLFWELRDKFCKFDRPNGAWGTCEMKKFDWLEFVCVRRSARAACQARGMTNQPRNQRDPSRAKYLAYFR